MNFRKRFDKRIEEDKRSMLTDGDMEFLNSLQNMVAERSEDTREGNVKVKTFNYKVLLMVVAAVLALTFAVLIILYYTLDSGNLNPVEPSPEINGSTDPANPTDPPFEYYSDNFVKAMSDTEELNGDLILFKFRTDESKYSVDIEKTYDSVSGDTLFYTLKISNTTPDIPLLATLEIVVNKNFNYDAIWYNNELIEATLSGYSIKYTQDITSTSVDNVTINRVECRGQMQIGDQFLYVIQYQETSLTEGTFLETLQSMLIFD